MQKLDYSYKEIFVKEAREFYHEDFYLKLNEEILIKFNFRDFSENNLANLKFKNSDIENIFFSSMSSIKLNKNFNCYDNILNNTVYYIFSSRNNILLLISIEDLNYGLFRMYLEAVWEVEIGEILNI